MLCTESSCLERLLTCKERMHMLKHFTYVLPQMPISFLLGLNDQRRLSFNICLRDGNAIHLRISAWKQLFPITVTTHVWLKFSPTIHCSLDTCDWCNIFARSMLTVAADVVQDIQYIFSFSMVPPAFDSLPESPTYTYRVPLCQREDWTTIAPWLALSICSIAPLSTLSLHQ